MCQSPGTSRLRPWPSRLTTKIVEKSTSHPVSQAILVSSGGPCHLRSTIVAESGRADVASPAPVTARDVEAPTVAAEERQPVPICRPRRVLLSHDDGRRSLCAPVGVHEVEPVFTRGAASSNETRFGRLAARCPPFPHATSPSVATRIVAPACSLLADRIEPTLLTCTSASRGCVARSQDRCGALLSASAPRLGAARTAPRAARPLRR